MKEMMKNAVLTDGMRLIQKTLGQFDTIKSKLEQGIKLCNEKKVKNDEAMAKLKSHNEELLQNSRQAANAISGINKLLSGE